MWNRVNSTKSIRSFPPCSIEPYFFQALPSTQLCPFSVVLSPTAPANDTRMSPQRAFRTAFPLENPCRMWFGGWTPWPSREASGELWFNEPLFRARDLSRISRTNMMLTQCDFVICNPLNSWKQSDLLQECSIDFDIISGSVLQFQPDYCFICVCFHHANILISK